MLLIQLSVPRIARHEPLIKNCSTRLCLSVLDLWFPGDFDGICDTDDFGAGGISGPATGFCCLWLREERTASTSEKQELKKYKLWLNHSISELEKVQLVSTDGKTLKHYWNETHKISLDRS